MTSLKCLNPSMGNQKCKIRELLNAIKIISEDYILNKMFENTSLIVNRASFFPII